MNLYNKKCLVCGMARSGQSAALLLKQLGAVVTAQDMQPYEKIKWTFSPEDEHIATYLGANPDGIIAGFDLIVLSPGIPAGLPFVEAARRLNIPVWGEIELAYRLCPCPIIAVTGTNGKTTVTTLVGDIMRQVRPTVVAGNIGVPFTGQIASLTREHIVVAEISSFQLETAVDFRPRVSAVLNVTPDHLDRHGDMAAYAATKARIFANQGPEDYTVLCRADPYSRAMRSPANVVYYDDPPLIDPAPYKAMPQNALAAAAIARCAGAPMEAVHTALAAFNGVEHRLEYVTTLRGVDFYNDSKATNTDAAIKALETMRRPVVLIGGGYDKDAGFDSWVQAFAGKVKRLIVLGATAEKILAACRAHGFTATERVNALRDAVELAAAAAAPGDVVLLSPACASWDMFDDYEQRGRLFKEFVHDLAEGGA